MVASDDRGDSIDFARLYEYRFKDVDQSQRQLVWSEIAATIHERMGRPTCVLDPAAGRCEFINAVPAAERWAVDATDHAEFRDAGVKAVIQDIFDAELPLEHFDGVFVSNFLEHLATQDDVARLLAKLRGTMQVGGRIAVLGPNFKYCYRDYFDCADHTLALTHVAVAEHLAAAGFTINSTIDRFLPFSFRSRLPASRQVTRAYLRMPVAWRLFGKQFLVIAQKVP
jgi:hypothetical protein